MHIKYFCPHWGSNHLDFKDFLQKVKSAGYDGVEMTLPLDAVEKVEIVNAIKEFGLLFIAQHWETITTDFEQHKVQYRRCLENLASASPLFINAHTGKDFFTFEQNAELIDIAAQVSKQFGKGVIHETHRGRFSFAAHITADFLKKLPDLKIAFDLSHWCNVAESYLEDQHESVDLAINRASHIHSRVGFPEGPQITDPRAPEWKEAVEIHLDWWKRIIELNRNAGKQIFTITTEFGPYPYMPILPFTKQPIASQWDVNVYMMNMLKSELK
jgi:hypothetical protein